MINPADIRLSDLARRQGMKPKDAERIVRIGHGQQATHQGK